MTIDSAEHERCAVCPSLSVGVTGSSGLVGSALVSRLIEGEHQMTRLARPGQGRDFPAGLDAVVHLAGEPIASGRWNAAKKARIRQSRVEGTRALSQTLAELANPPRVLVCASAVGFYGSRGDEVLDEESTVGEGFLAEVVQAWEEATQPARQRGIRVVSLRFGMILSPRGGALAKMLTPFAWGLGGRIGSGRQYWSWISLNDASEAILHALTTEDLSGPVNAVAPTAPTNAEFISTLGRVLHRPALAAVPAWTARFLFGPMADALLLASVRAVPRRLRETGYKFRYGELEAALRHLLGR